LRGWQRGVSPAPVYPLRLRLRLRYLAGLFQGVRSILFVTPLDVAVDCSASKKSGVGCGRPTAAKILLSSTQNIRQQHPTEVFRPMYLKQVLSSSWDGPPFGHNRHGPEPSSIFVPTGILIHLAVWPQKDMGRKLRGAVPIFRGQLDPQLYTMSPGPSPVPPCQVPTWSIQPFPKYTSVTDRKDRQRSDRIGRTVLQTVARRCLKLKLLRLFYV